MQYPIRTSENIVTLDSVWMNMVRGIAISAVVIHHWLLFLPHQSSISIFYTAAELIETLAGTAVHLFFVLSGCGLTLSYFTKDVFSWRQWAAGRFRKIIVPYCVIVTLTFISVNLLHYPDDPNSPLHQDLVNCATAGGGMFD